MTIELDGASLQEGAMDGLTLLEVYVGAEKVWPTRDTVQITLGTGFEARDQLRAALTDRGLDSATVTEIPFDIRLIGAGSATYMFQECSALTSVPWMDTGSVTNMNGMFNGCSSLTHVPNMATAQVTDMRNMFQGCSALTSVPWMDTGSVTNMNTMFTNCSSLTTVPDMNTSRVTNMGGMFSNCSSLTYAPDMVTSRVTNTRNMFYNCVELADGNVRLIGKHPSVSTTGMIDNSGLTREPFYDTAGNPI